MRKEINGSFLLASVCVSQRESLKIAFFGKTGNRLVNPNRKQRATVNR